MKGCGYLQDARANGSCAKSLRGGFDVFRGAGKNQLLGGIAVGDDKRAFFFEKKFLHELFVGLNRQHGSPVGAVLGCGHQSSAQSGEAMQLCCRDAAGAAQCGQFAITVAAGGLRTDAEMMEHVQGTHADRADRRLCKKGGGQGFFLLPAHIVAERGVRIDGVAEPARRVTGCISLGMVCHESAIGFAQRLEHARELACKVPHHADILRTLARKQRPHLALCLARSEGNAGGRGPRGLSGIVFQHGQR